MFVVFFSERVSNNYVQIFNLTLSQLIYPRNLLVCILPPILH